MTLDGEYEPSPIQWVRDQIERYERSGGTEADTLPNTDLRIVVVTMRGSRTGKVRKIALMRVEHGGEYALVGSMGGSPTDPVWVSNLRAHPDEVLVQDGPAPFPVHVRELEGDERALWWQRAVDAFPTYEQYRQRTSRTIPVFLASPTR